MHINGKQIFLAIIIIIVMAVLLGVGKLSEGNFLVITSFIVGYYFGSARGLVFKNNQKKKEGG